MPPYNYCELPTEYTTELIEHLCEHQVLKGDPIVFIDVGCSGGIHKMWRAFDSSCLVAHGFDPVEDEVKRLNKVEPYPHVQYHHYYIGLQEDHPIKRTGSRAACCAGVTDINEGSGMHAVSLAKSSDDFPQNITVGSTKNPSADRIALDDFLKRESIPSVDYLKTDTDGFDIEVLYSAKELIDRGEILGICVETAMTGIGGNLYNGFANIHPMLQNAGYTFFGLSSPANYSLKVLPDLFAHDFFAQTVRGMTLCTNAIYMQDLLHCEQKVIKDSTLLKLLCIYVLQGYHDWAAATILRYEDQLLKLGLNSSTLLDMLTPKLFGTKIPYKEYIDIFNANPELFLPKNKEQLRARVIKS